jgi:outer membrane biosynthesis protein TonB
MTARIVLLMAAVVGLAACESTKSVSSSGAPASPATTIASSPSDSAPLVVRGPLVVEPGDSTTLASVTPKATKKDRVSAGVSHASAEPVTEPDSSASSEPAAAPEKPAKPAKPNKADKTAPITTADATPTPAEPPASTPSDTSAPTPTDTAPDTAEPTTTAQPAADTSTTKSLFSDPAALMKAQIAGFPVWLIALVSVVLLLALIVGFGGRRKSEEVV